MKPWILSSYLKRTPIRTSRWLNWKQTTWCSHCLNCILDFIKPNKVPVTLNQRWMCKNRTSAATAAAVAIISIVVEYWFYFYNPTPRPRIVEQSCCHCRAAVRSLFAWHNEWKCCVHDDGIQPVMLNCLFCRFLHDEKWLSQFDVCLVQLNYRKHNRPCPGMNPHAWVIVYCFLLYVAVPLVWQLNATAESQWHLNSLILRTVFIFSRNYFFAVYESGREENSLTPQNFSFALIQSNRKMKNYDINLHGKLLDL